MELAWSEATLRIMSAILLGSVVGLERELTNKSAGLRTHILVCLGSTVFTIISVSDMLQGVQFDQLANTAQSVHITLNRDPARIAAQILTGIGFIGGGAVLRYGTSIRGLTTAASLWVVSSIGMLCGTGYYKLAALTTFLTFLVLFTIGRIERLYFAKHQPQARHKIRLTLPCTAEEAPSLIKKLADWLHHHQPHAETVSVQTAAEKTTVVIALTEGTLKLADWSYRLSLALSLQELSVEALPSKVLDNS